MTSKKSVGIITLHYVDNHGGVLLAYALQEKIDQLGYAASVVDYDPTPVPSRMSFFLATWLRRIGNIPGYLRRAPQILRRIFSGSAIMPPRHPHKSSGMRAARFAEFRKKWIRMTPESWSSSTQLHASPPKFDAYVCGSDQIWNPYMCRPDGTPGFDSAYFLSFAPVSLRVSYAPSVSVPDIPTELKAEFRRLASGILQLSCREESGAQLISDAVSRPVKVVLDPALLLTAADWRRVSMRPSAGRYLLCYFLGNGRHYRDYALALSRQLGIEIRVISSDIDDAAYMQARQCHDIGPDEFLGLIEGAECVCTDSFHGTLFSIVFERQFHVFERPGSAGTRSMSSRIHSILGRLGLSDRLVRDGQVPARSQVVIDYAAPSRRLAELREDSIAYLRDALAATQVRS
jgi:hypothetical protein